MEKKRLTQRFPWLLPLRTRQRKLCFYWGMRLDGSTYAETRQQTLLPEVLFTSSCPMYNRATGCDMRYQENKVANLKLAAASIHGMCIGPGETFSFCRATRYADRETPYKEGLTVIDGQLTTTPGGGLCMLSNLLFWVFLHSPLTIVERHGHTVKDFPEPESDAPLGVDATIAEGWLDLKVRNDTDQMFQISVTFDETHIIGALRIDRPPTVRYAVDNENLRYLRKNGRVLEQVDVVQRQLDAATGDCLARQVLYTNCCEIGYPLPADTPVEERED